MPREMPQAPEAEAAVLGAVLLDGADALTRVIDGLTADAFHDPAHRLIYDSMLRLYHSHATTDPVTVIEDLALRGLTERVGGTSVVTALMDAVPSGAGIERHAAVVRDRYMRRQLYHAGASIAETSLDAAVTTEDAIDAAERLLLSVSEGRSAEGPLPASKVLWDAMAIIEGRGRKGVPSGLHELDAMTGGWKPGNLILVGGSTSMGKSAAALQFAAHAAVNERVPTAIFSIEMTREENLCRIIAQLAQVDLKQLTDGEVPAHCLPDIETAATALHGAGLWLDDSATTVAEIRSRARRLKAENGLGLIVVDHIHDMQEKGESRREQLGTIARGLKHLAMELDIPVIAAAQLSRKPNTRTDPRPQIADLHESGDIEQASNVILLVYRPEYFHGPRDKDGNDLVGRAEIIIGKQRNGPTGSVEVFWRSTATRFEALQPERSYAAA